MNQYTYNKLETFLQKEGYKINSSKCSEEEKKIFECWVKIGFQKVSVPLGKRVFNTSNVRSIFTDQQLTKKFLDYLNN